MQSAPCKQIFQPNVLFVFTEVNAGCVQGWGGSGELRIEHSLSRLTGKWVFGLVLCYRNLFRNLLENLINLR